MINCTAEKYWCLDSVETALYSTQGSRVAALLKRTKISTWRKCFNNLMIRPTSTQSQGEGTTK